MNVSAADIRNLECSAMRDYGIPSLLLMENAGRGIADLICGQYPACRVSVFCGTGNNGGDGFVVARHLSNRGYQTRVVLLCDPNQLRNDPLVNFNIILKMRLPINVISVDDQDNDSLRQCLNTDIVVDAILGIGTNRSVTGLIKRAVQAINDSGHPVFSVDVPSGLDADTGKIWGVSISATQTITLALAKKGLFINDGTHYSGKVGVVDIGIPTELLIPFRS